MTEIQERLFALKDDKYRDFNSSLIPTLDKELVIGVRVPQLRKLAKELKGGRLAEDFLLLFNERLVPVLQGACV